jgi:hypothetical protein
MTEPRAVGRHAVSGTARLATRQVAKTYQAAAQGPAVTSFDDDRAVSGNVGRRSDAESEHSELLGPAKTVTGSEATANSRSAPDDN